MLEKDNLQKADGEIELNEDIQSENNPEEIISDLKDEADNLIESSGENNNELKEDFQENETTESKEASPTPSATEEIDSENNPESIVENLDKEADNLIEPKEDLEEPEITSSEHKTKEELSVPETETTTESSVEASESSIPEKDTIETEDDNSKTEDSIDEKDQADNKEKQESVAEKPEVPEEEVAVTKTKKEDSHVAEIEESNAEDAEDSGNDERHNLESKDYEKMSMAELNSEFEKLLKHQKIQTIKSHVDDIRSEFKTKFDNLLEEKKEQYIKEGGDEQSFYYSSDEKKRFNENYKSYKEKLRTYYKDLDKTLKENLANRLAIIEDIKGLINVEENINTTYKHFKELQEKWRNAGNIPRDKYNNTWNTYHHHVEIFYDFLHLNRDLRDMDFKHNLEQKQKIIERAEELAKDENINRAFRELQVLHKMWKEDLGPVAKEHRDEIWERFSSATKSIHDKRQAYYADLDKAYEVNLERKKGIIESIENVITEMPKSHQDWQKKIKEVEKLRQEFFNAGKVPKKVNEKIWAEFKNAVRKFNREKNQYYKKLKQDQYDNLSKKLELIKIAEDNKDSEDYETVTQLMKRIQSDWKKIGHVPRKDSDKVWKRFKNACNHYFDKLNSKRKEDNKELYEAFDLKTKILQEIKGYKLSKDGPEANKKAIQKFIEQWNSLGSVPHNKRYVEGKFNKAINDLYDQLKLEQSDIEMIKYDNKLENLSKPEGTDLLDNEQNYIRKKIDELKGEINQLENNMQFFSNVDESNPLVKEVVNNLNKHKANLTIWEEKLYKVKKMY